MAALVSMNTMVPCLCTIHAHSVSGGTSHDAPTNTTGDALDAQAAKRVVILWHLLASRVKRDGHRGGVDTYVACECRLDIANVARCRHVHTAHSFGCPHTHSDGGHRC